jgi:hypothetical protein
MAEEEFEEEEDFFEANDKDMIDKNINDKENYGDGDDDDDDDNDANEDAVDIDLSSQEADDKEP